MEVVMLGEKIQETKIRGRQGEYHAIYLKGQQKTSKAC